MATIDAFMQLLCVLVLILHSLIVSAPAVKYCFNGIDINSMGALRNQSCSTGEIHLSETLFVTDHQMSPFWEERDVDTFSGESTNGVSRDTTSYCLIFRYILTQVISSGVKQESVHMKFECDTRNVCEDKELDKLIYDVTVNDTKGQLYCCTSENCNRADILPHLPAENRICYYGTNNGSHSPAVDKESCIHPDVMCAKLTTFLAGRKLESYFCDNDKVCQGQMLTGSFRSCVNTTMDNVTQEMCCCDTSLCFEPSWPKISSNPKDQNSSNNIPPFSDTRTIAKPVAEPEDKLVITGLFVSLVFVTGVAAGIIFVMACKKRRQPRQDPNVIMQYERLSAADPDVEDAVVL